KKIEEVTNKTAEEGDDRPLFPGRRKMQLLEYAELEYSSLEEDDISIEAESKEKLESNESSEADKSKSKNATEYAKLFSNPGSVIPEEKTKKTANKKKLIMNKSWLVDALSHIDENAFGHLHKGLRKIKEYSKALRPDGMTLSSWREGQLKNIIEHCQ